MKSLIKYIKEKYNVGVYVLSNISKYFAEHSHEIEILKEADGCIFSAYLGITKPDHRIFKHLCEKFQINPYEAIFVDDNPNNIASSIEFGLNGYLFDKDAEKLKAYFDEILK